MKKSRLKDPVTHTIWAALIFGFLLGWHFFDTPAKPPHEVWMEAETIYVVQERGGSVFVFGKIGEEDWECTGSMGPKWGEREKGGGSIKQQLKIQIYKKQYYIEYNY